MNNSGEYKTRLESLYNSWNITYLAMREDYVFAGGGEGMWENGLYAKRKGLGMPNLSLPLLPPYIDKIVSSVRTSPPSMAVKTKDQGVQDLTNGIIRGIEKASTSSSSYTTSIKCSATAGLGWLYLAIEVDNGQNVIRIKTNRDPLSIMLDPSSTYLDGRDAQYAVIHGFMQRDLAIREFGEKAGEEAISAPEQHMIFNVPSDAVLDCVWYEMVEGGVNVTRRIGSHEDEPLFLEGLTGLPIVPVYGEELLVKESRKWGGIIKRGREINSSLNIVASNIMMLVASTPKQPLILDPESIEGREQDYKDMALKPKSYLPFKSWDLKNNRPYPTPFRLDNTAQTQGLQMTAEWLQSLIGRTNGISDAMLGGLESSMESGKSMIARMDAAEGAATATYIDHLTISITQLSRILIQMLPLVYNTERSMVVIDEYGQSTRMMGNLSEILTPDVVDMLDVEISAGPHMEMKRKASSQSLETMITAVGPEKGIALLKLWAEAQPLHDKQSALAVIDKLIPPEFQEDKEEGDIPDEAKAALMQATQAIEGKDQVIGQMESIITQLQGALQAQEGINAVELQKATIKAETDIEKQFMANTNKKEVALINQGATSQRLAAQLTADEQSRVDDFTADMLKQKQEAILEANKQENEPIVEPTAKLPNYIREEMPK